MPALAWSCAHWPGLEAREEASSSSCCWGLLATASQEPLSAPSRTLGLAASVWSEDPSQGLLRES